MNISDKLEKLLRYNSAEATSFDFDEEYQNVFANEGDRKTQYIINDLSKQVEKQSIDLGDFAYLCIGGADGSESESILQNTPIRHSILIEFSDLASDNAKKRIDRLKEKGKKLYVLTGDAGQKLDIAISKLEELKETENIQGLILSTQAVLHELPRRSPGFNLPLFLGKCFSVYDFNAFYAREPIAPENWPDLVELLIPGIEGKRLAAFSSLINEKLSISEKKPIAVGKNHVSMDNKLALEVLHKLLRSNSIQAFKHELEEQLTWIDPYMIKKIIEKDLGIGSARVEAFITEGFEDAWNRYNVKVRTPEGDNLSIPNTHARIKAFSFLRRHETEKFQSEKFEISSETINAVKKLKGEFTISRRDIAGKSRRRSLNSISAKLEKILSTNSFFNALELRVRVWRQIALESRSIKDYLHASEKTSEYVDALFACSMTIPQKFNAVELFTEWAIDFSQLARATTDFNKIAARLNMAIKFLGQQIEPSISKQKECAVLCMRAKCRRALASLLQRRGRSGKTAKKEINKHRWIALKDAERGFKAYPNDSSRFELALCLFSNSKTVNNENAKRGMLLLREAYDEGNHILAGYELVKQLRMRHEFEECVDIFKNIGERDKDRRRFHENVTYFAAAVIGMYYEGTEPSKLRENSLLAREWLEELITQEHHSAREVIDYCFIRIICGFPVIDALTPLENLKPSSEMVWNELAEIAVDLSKGGNALGEAILLGIDEAYVWGRIGTLYSDFTEDFEKAIEFYDRASIIDNRSPVFYFNKARTLAYKLKNYESAKISYDYAKNLIKNNYGWYKCNEVSLNELESEIAKNIINEELTEPDA